MSVNKHNSTAILASFATLKSLLDEKKYKSSYQVLQEFIHYIIVIGALSGKGFPFPAFAVHGWG